MTAPTDRKRDVVLFTKTYLPDLERVLTLLRSLRYVENQIPHVVVVDDDHLDAMSPALKEFAVDLVPTSALVPASMKRAASVSARLGKISVRAPAIGAVARRTYGSLVGYVDGWWAQQAVKIAAGAAYPGSALVNADSDLVFLETPCRDWFVRENGIARLFERDAVSLKDIEWKLRAHRVLDLDRFADAPTSYTTMPQVIDARVAVGLIEFLEERYRLPWWRTMLARHATEYELYGSFAAHLSNAGIVAEQSAWSVEISPWRLERSARELGARLSGDGPAVRVAWLQSSLPAADYQRLHQRLSVARFGGEL